MRGDPRGGEDGIVTLAAALEAMELDDRTDLILATLEADDEARIGWRRSAW